MATAERNKCDILWSPSLVRNTQLFSELVNIMGNLVCELCLVEAAFSDRCKCLILNEERMTALLMVSGGKVFLEFPIFCSCVSSSLVYVDCSMVNIVSRHATSAVGFLLR